MGRIEPVRHEGAFRMLEQTARLRDGKARRVARQDRLGSHNPLDSRQQCLFGSQVFRNRLRHELCIRHSLAFRSGRVQAGNGWSDVARLDQAGVDECRQVDADTLDQRVTSGCRLVEASDLISGQRERLGNAMPHRPQPQDRDPVNAALLFHDLLDPVSSTFVVQAPT